MSFGVSRLAPMLPDFLQARPQGGARHPLSDEVVDLVGNRLDLALRIAAMADSSLRARRLCSVRLLLVGAPEYFEKHGRPEHPRELARHRALQYAYQRGGTAWRFRHPHRGEFTQVVPTQLQTNNAEVFLPVLRAGLGLALQPEFLVWQDLRDGTLESVLDDWQGDPIALHILTPPGRRRPTRVQALADYLGGEVGGGAVGTPSRRV